MLKYGKPKASKKKDRGQAEGAKKKTRKIATKPSKDRPSDEKAN